MLVLYILSDSVLYLDQLCQSISQGFRVTDLNSRVDARVVAIYKGA